MEINEQSEYNSYSKKEQQNPTHSNNLQKTIDDLIKPPQEAKTNQNQHPKQKKNNPFYRPDIDGLRTIAIMTVVIYHAFPKFLQGGFIGVDVFFVISGYLISHIIIKETRKNKFTYVNFYSRRVRRIYPALILIMVFVFYVVSKYYGPMEIDFSLKTLSAATIFGANFQVLVHEKGYFDPDVHINPLLHLWSLGVEEQFYIFWPCLISIGLNFFKNRTFIVLAIYTGISFIFSIVSVYQNPKFAFYFPVCRFWQMAVGGLVAYLSIKIKDPRITNALSIVGTTSILITVWIINDNSLFPGFWALIPTLAAACIIQAGPQPFVNKMILSSRPFVFIGKISYPMYLWHWPLLVFSRYFYPSGSTSILGNVYLMLILTVIFSVLTYFMVEKPLRKIKTKKIVIVLFVTLLFIGFYSFHTLLKSRQIQYFFNNVQLGPMLQKAEKQMMPQKQDYVEIRGKMHPNLSKNRNRMFPTFQKTKLPTWDMLKDFDKGFEMVLQKDIDKKSKYYREQQINLSAFQVANQGSKNQLFIMGDSHCLRLSYRFQQLYRDSVAKNKTDEFPTVVSMIKLFTGLNSSNVLLNFSMSLIKQHLPQRLLLLCHWPIYYCENVDMGPVYCDMDRFKVGVGQMLDYVRQVQKLGVEVSTLTINLHHVKFSPSYMIQFVDVIAENIKPFSLSEYRMKFKDMYEYFESTMKQANVSLIDLSDNLCYNDLCEVTSPKGYAVYYDNHHYSKFYARHWLSMVDHLAEF